MNKWLAVAILILGASLPASAQAAHSAKLTWIASTDAGATYNVYRLSGACPATGTAGFVKVTGQVGPAVTYTDGTVIAGVYCYYVTAVLNGVESVPSGVVSAVIPVNPPTGLSVLAL